ncbi:alpha-glucosidase [Tessaracoccus sp. Y36]
MSYRLLTKRSTIHDLYRHPMGRDIVDKLFLQTGLPRRLIYLFAGLPIGVVEKLTERISGPGMVDMILGLVNSETERPRRGRAPDPTPWWREAVFYQVYPRSFADSNGDGVGDIRGIIGKLDYLQQLGVDCLWLSPVFDSPNEDMGYDVRDYRAVMEEMGTLEDLDELIAECHDRGLRIILDLVVNHTSAHHEWFQKALKDPDGKYGGYYFLEKGSPDQPPNNWRSFFSGPAWRWFPEAERWALRLFAEGQVDLNWDNDEVRAEVADIVTWWMKRGIDGFRLDVINYISKKPGLPDGHPFIGELLEFIGVEHYFYGPRLHEFLRGLRREGFTRREAPVSTPRRKLPDGELGDPLPPDMIGIMVGETPGIGMELGRLLSGYGRGELDLIFNFDVLDNPGRTRWHTYDYKLWYLKRFYRAYDRHLAPNDWIAVFLDNHDNPRMLSKFGGGREADPAVRTAIGKMLATIQLTMRGTPFLFQGQELGATNHAFEDVEQLRDVESINRHADLLTAGMSKVEAWKQILAGTRDHARVPMRWDPDGGFSEAPAWLAGTDTTPGFSAKEQMEDPDSVFAWHRALIALRRKFRALTLGDLRWVHRQKKYYFAYQRTLGAQRFLIECNTTGRKIKRPHVRGTIVPVLGGPRGPVMEPWEATVSRIY